MKCEKCGKEIRMMDAQNGLCRECAEKTEATAQAAGAKSGIGCGMWCLIAVGALVVLIIIISAIGGGSDGKVEAFTFVQMEIKSYLPAADVSIKNAEIISTDLRYKVEGTFTANGLQYQYWGIITFDDTSYKSCTMNYLQIGDIVLFDR